MSELLSFEICPFHAAKGGLPMLVQACEPELDLCEMFDELKVLVDRYLLDCGGILFRGFRVGGAEAFQNFAASFGHPLLSYEFGSTPRTNIVGGVYTSTEYPAHQRIPLHNEQAYTLAWPMKIWFYSVIPAETGGETPIADSREVYRKIPLSIRERLVDRGLMYVRNYGSGLDVAWEKVFNTDNPQVVESYCRAHDIQCEWRDGGELRTRQICQAVACHPKTGEMVWFNQAHLFHVSNLQADVRESLLEVVEEQDLPRNVYYGDGAPIEDSLLDEVRGVLDECTISFPWLQDDVMMLDNMLAAHARSPFTGKRRLVVAMAEGYSDRL